MACRMAACYWLTHIAAQISEHISAFNAGFHLVLAALAESVVCHHELLTIHGGLRARPAAS
jgi:hypothetical protein